MKYVVMFKDEAEREPHPVGVFKNKAEAMAVLVKEIDDAAEFYPFLSDDELSEMYYIMEVS
jgi:hypothetical protein